MEQSENFSEELEEPGDSEDDDSLSVIDSEECAEQGEVAKQSDNFETVAVDTSQVACCGECRRDIDPVQITDASILTRTRKLQGKKWRQFSSAWYKSNPWSILCRSRLKAFCALCREAKRGELIECKRGGVNAF